jgi:hypothetical protein
VYNKELAMAIPEVLQHPKHVIPASLKACPPPT